MALRYSLQDVDGIRRKIARLQRELPDEIGRAIRVEAEIEATECKRRTPVDTGNLRASIHVEGPIIEQNGSVSCAIAAGGPAAPYAVHVHENLEAYHPVGQAKFIEEPLRESAPFLAARIANRLREGLIRKVSS
jgi:hypothetical protein